VVAWVGPWPDADIEDGAIVQAAPCGYGLISVEDTARNFDLDLTDATGRAHAAWWIKDRQPILIDWPPPSAADEACIRAITCADMTPAQIDTLTRLILRLTGRSHV
jgi:hypothetical protein